MRLRQPVRQSDTAQPAVLDDLLGRIGAYADTEVMNDALRTPGLHSGTQEVRHTYAVKEQSSTELAPAAPHVRSDRGSTGFPTAHVCSDRGSSGYRWYRSDGGPAGDGSLCTGGAAPMPRVRSAGRAGDTMEPLLPAYEHAPSHLQHLPHANTGRGLRKDWVCPARETPSLRER